MKNSKNDFPWNGNELVSNEYKKKNIEVITLNNSAKRAVIFFSSNGIFFPNTERVFRDKILNKNRYEWKKLSRQKCIRQNFKKIIFVRDIYKQWYVTGINKDLDSIDKLYYYLKDLLSGYRITTCGSSSGGYMALLMGSMLGAERIIDNCGQFNLNLINNPGSLIEMYKDDSERNRYYDLTDFTDSIIENLFYFYSNRVDDDLKQFDYMRNRRIKSFAVESNIHGKTIKSICFPYLLSVDDEAINKIYQAYSSGKIDAEGLYKMLVPYRQRIFYTVYSFFKR